MRLNIILCTIEAYYVYAAVLRSKIANEKTTASDDFRFAAASTSYSFDKTYPLTVSKTVADGIEFKIALVADLDGNSKTNGSDNTWVSDLLYGTLTWNYKIKTVAVKFDSSPSVLISSFNIAGRGMELSELIVYDGKLLTMDDRTGIVYRIKSDTIFPWIILADGNGYYNRGFKCEWATVKGDQLIIGSTGKFELFVSSNSSNIGRTWIKIIDSAGRVEHVDWKNNYKKIEKALEIEYPGYITHESVVWSPIHKKWFFLPRKISKQAWERFTDQYQGTNLLIIVDENFENITVKTIGDVSPIRGFSSFKFIPSSGDTVIAAIKSEEVNDTTATYVTVFSIDGIILLPDTKVSDLKYEGFEFA